MDMRRRWVSAGAAVAVVVGLASFVTTLRAESPNSDVAAGEGIALQRPVTNTRTRKAGLTMPTKLLLAADAAARGLDAYSTTRMLRNRCNGNRSVPVCNEEMFLPDFITHSNGMIYGYEGGMWIAQAFVVHRLAKHHHEKLARFIPTLDIATTLPFAVNNLRLPVNPGSK